MPSKYPILKPNEIIGKYTVESKARLSVQTEYPGFYYAPPTPINRRFR